VEQQTPIDLIASNDAVVVKLLDPPSAGEIEARVIDVCRMHLRLLSRAQIPRDAYLVVKMKNYMLFGEVGYCCPSDGAYDVGLLIQESLCLRPLESRPATLVEIVNQERV
jgi:hypothetical protein